MIIHIHLLKYIDGTMINLFYIPSLQIWEISTKTYIGGKNNFYMNTTNDNNKNNFRTLFYEALSFNSLTTDQLDTSLVYSFVLQHPQNKIIKHIDNPTSIYVPYTKYKILSFKNLIFNHPFILNLYLLIPQLNYLIKMTITLIYSKHNYLILITNH